MYEIEQYSRHLLDEAINMKVTDLHFIPEEEFYLLAYRLNGRMVHWKRLNLRLAERLISHLKYRSGMDIGERRKPQSTLLMHSVQHSPYSLRLSTLPTIHSESLAVRILPYFSTQTISSLSFFNHHVNTFKKICSINQGLCLISGPTGSGKTTTLYTIVEELIRIGGKSIITIEDPIERVIPHAVQVEVNNKAGLSFDSVLSACLRHDPDVILIGEIRDEETAALAIRASLTGHVVLATLHAQDGYTALLRMMDLGVSRFDLLECCKVVFSQRVINVRCPLCREGCHPFCQARRKMSRSAIFEIVNGEQLKEMIEKRKYKGKGFLSEINKAWALGFIEDTEWQRYANEFV
ncbi:competence type IV pilus ATPase ComGA [Halalkalibacter krulwichiae]|uniref:Putative type II secretion system protein E n=1 Tax=Halalkalibacter krulwichiae TaxID=199441 RepID=A0A1X9MDC7_9BACI|nr:competence type IV pilus ATPase ComGA [Halalkalibacter krulwichiae]ARK31437.1 Putative type II secretion system protein E [Halalkalibacter krulwichiae]